MENCEPTLIGVEWSDYDPKTGVFRAGIAFEDGSGAQFKTDPPKKPDPIHGLDLRPITMTKFS